jgi:hypothetical protein
MRLPGFSPRSVLLVATVVGLWATPKLVFGQNFGRGGGGGGVAVDAQGVLRVKSAADASGLLTKERVAAARASLNPKVATFSNLRYISLKHLEQAIIDKGGNLTEEMKNLAGLLRLHYVFFFPESKDIVIAGKAEGWGADSFGRNVGLQSGRPVIQLQDLVVALRMFPPGGQPTRLIGCSIDPTEEGLAAMQRFLRSVGSGHNVRDAQRVQMTVVQGLKESLGLQTVTINGVPPKTHFAQVMVEADYRMKLIGIGLEKPPVKLVSYVDRASPNQIARNALVRWFFTPDYECVRTNDDGTAMELVGDGVKVVGEDELVGAGGQRTAVGRGNRASQAFVTSFTKAYSELADRSPVYAELRNLIDLSVAAAYVQQQDFYGKSGWKMELFGDEKSFTVEIYHAPKQVETAVNAVWKGQQLVTPVGGGVQIEALMALAPEKRISDDKGKVAKLREQTKIELPKGRWWWDAAAGK